MQSEAEGARTEAHIASQVDGLPQLDALDSSCDKERRHCHWVAVVAVSKGDVACKAVEVLECPPDADAVPRVAILHSTIHEKRINQLIDNRATLVESLSIRALWARYQHSGGDMVPLQKIDVLTK
jgi:hypothetical protein